MEVVGPALSPEDGPSAGHEPPILPWPSRGSGSSTAIEARTSPSWCWSYAGVRTASLPRAVDLTAGGRFLAL